MKKKKADLAALGEWKHINCLQAGARDNIKDEILRRLVYIPEPKRNKAPIPQTNDSKTRIDSLLEAIDLENVTGADMNLELTVDDVPGGTLSFLFERGSIVSMDDDESERDDSP